MIASSLCWIFQGPEPAAVPIIFRQAAFDNDAAKGVARFHKKFAGQVFLHRSATRHWSAIPYQEDT
jgi:hypothetical protein